MRLGGLLIEQYAGVTAALAEGLPLDDILAQEEIAQAEWPGAERAWCEALVSATDLQLSLARWTREAEDALARKIEPVDADAAAWAGLLAGLSLAEDPAKMLADLGLGMPDVARLGRRWKKRCEAEPKLVTELTEAAGKAQPPARVRAEPIKLKRFPWSPAAKTRAAAAGLGQRVDGALPIENDLDLYAAFMAISELAPTLLLRATQMCALDAAERASVMATWRARFESEPELNADYTVRLLDHRAVIERILAGARVVEPASSSAQPRV